ncbi:MULTISPECIES: NUDIX hydrolase [unclassified Myroides]|uniref:NUDIX hydrolase n=1 Tax=unclassified Myroides TaxID=2642485 RepID=UPI003D2F5FCE
MSRSQTLYLASALITDTLGSLLTVRKKGSMFYMMAGGKIEQGETPVEALQRELKEELDLTVDAHHMRYLGSHQTQAVNEANTLVHASIYHIELTNATLRPHAELEEIKWLTYDTYQQVPLAHLIEEFSIPIWLQNKKSQP